MATSKNNYQRLVEIQKSYPELSFQNEGYEELAKEIIAKNEKVITEITSILKEEFQDFIRFQNFKISKDGTILIRFQAYWDHVIWFQGVNYVPLESLKN